MKRLCIYHGSGCIDGFASAMVVHMRFQGEVDLMAADYHDLLPAVADLRGREIYIVDFSYPTDVLLWMVDKAGGAGAAKITVIDHHKTAADQLAPFQLLPSGAPRHPRISAHFDLNSSGAILTWHFFYPMDEAPMVLKHVEDRDLFHFRMAHTRQISAALRSYPLSVGVWTQVLTATGDEHYGLRNLHAEGVVVLRLEDEERRRVIQASKRSLIIGGVTVPACNAPRFMASEICHALNRTSPFAATYHDSDAGRHFELRSSKESGVDVSAVAEKYGGGGHQHAAGFTVSIAKAMQFEIPTRQRKREGII